MALNLIKSLLLLLLIHLIVNEEIPISSYEHIKAPQGINNYSYQFIESNIPEGKYGYFYFKFKDSPGYKTISLDIIEENGISTSITIDKVYWLCYNITNLKSQKYIFQIKNNYRDYNVSVIFLDSTKEINLSLDQFINLNFDSHKVENRPPIPIIFNLNISEEEEGFYYFKENEYDADSIFYDADYLLYFCEIEEDKECNFTGFQSLFFDKNKKYKIKQSCYKNNDYYYFTLFSMIKEIEFGMIKFTQYGDRNYRYYLLNIENNTKFYIDSKVEYYGGFLNENDKYKLPNYISEIDFSSYSKDIKLIENKGYNYFIVRIKDDYININVTMYFFNEMYEIDADRSVIVSEGKKALIILINGKYSIKKKYIVSSNNNIGIIDSNYNPKNLQNFFYFNERGGDIYVYVDSKEKTFVKYITYFYYYSFSYSLFNYINNNNLTNFFNDYNTDSMFFRGISSSSNYAFNITYFFDIKEKYYLYIKKYYGYGYL